MAKDIYPYQHLLGGNELNGDPQGFNEGARGVFAQCPAATPKYSAGPLEEGQLYTLARLFVPVQKRALSSYTSAETEDAKRLVDQLGISGYGGFGYVDFILQQATETMEEKVQIVDVLSDNYVAFYFGAAPPIFQYSGILLNTQQDDWRASFSVLYNLILRGSKLSQARKLVTLSYDNIMVTGTIMNHSQTLQSVMETGASFNFSMLVKQYAVGLTYNRRATSLEEVAVMVPPYMQKILVTEQPQTRTRSLMPPTSTTTSRECTTPSESKYVTKDDQLAAEIQAYSDKVEADRKAESGVNLDYAAKKKIMDKDAPPPPTIGKAVSTIGPGFVRL